MEEKNNENNEQDQQTKQQAEGRVYLILAAVWFVLAAVCHRHLIEMIAFAAVGAFMAVRAVLKIKGGKSK